MSTCMFKLLLFMGFLLVIIPLASASSCNTPSVRKEWRTLSATQKAEWIRSVKCLAKLPHSEALTPLVNPPDIPSINKSGSYYDDFAYMHMDLNTHIHNTGLFFPFHRWYVSVYESALKERCGFTGVSPYWNWSMDASDFQHGSIFQDPDPVSGLGGFGDPSKDFSVIDGAFADFMVAYPSPHILRRNFTLQPFKPVASQGIFADPDIYANTTFTYSEVRKMVNGFEGDYEGFQFYFEGVEGAHGCVHLITGGDLGGQCPTGAKECTPGPTFSPNEPMFWLHHAMVDKVWYDWQHKHPSNLLAFKGGSVQNITSMAALKEYPNGMPPDLSLDSIMPADGMFPEVSIRDLLDTTGGYLCYVYE